MKRTCSTRKRKWINKYFGESMFPNVVYKMSKHPDNFLIRKPETYKQIIDSFYDALEIFASFVDK